ncbi:LuxR C-terminal-related transcriptional regulator [Streptomyces sp. NPDC058326]|uniref:LuxR C-terminal-related transcriptional regulator n=1 Tax=Streptomyces sp. NPDC058326 TaxID=3346447 RepID=UPI0036F0F24F
MLFYSEAWTATPSAEGCPECLLTLGLLQRAPDGTLVPIPPGLAADTLMRPLEAVIAEKQRTLAAARASIHRAEEIYRSSYRTSSAPVREITGAPVISAALASAVSSAQEELLTAQPGGGRPRELLEKALASDLLALGRGVRQRTIYQHTVRSHGPTLSYVERVLEAGGEVRTLNEVFDRLIVVDRKIAFIPDPAQERHTVALAIEHPGTIRYLVGIFEHAWERATALAHAPTEHRPPLLTDQTRQAILQLMVNGYTDESIAARLGMSTRTVANHVRKASELLGSKSRAQLAYLVGRTGLLNTDAEEPTL